jgi:hypothetical protein
LPTAQSIHKEPKFLDKQMVLRAAPILSFFYKLSSDGNKKGSYLKHKEQEIT